MRRRLILWRHAKSAWDEPGLDDIARPLSGRGQKAAPKMARMIATKWKPDCVLCSPARRTVATWSYLAPLLAPDLPLAFDARIYEAEWSEILAAVRETPAVARRLLVIGHNPGLEDLTAALAEPVGQKFATAAVSVLGIASDWPALMPGEAKLLAFARP